MIFRARSLRAAVLPVTVAAWLAGCGSSTKVVSDTAPTGSTTTSSSGGAPGAATASTASTTTGSGSLASSANPGGTATGRPRCTAAVLSLGVLGQQGATGHGELGFSLRNTGRRTCHTFGYPGVLFLSAGGRPLPTTSSRVTRDFFGPAPTVGLDLAPGQMASFRLGVTHGQASSAGCTTASALQVIPPNDTHTLRVTIPHGAYECGTATVSPLRPGTTAFI